MKHVSHIWIRLISQQMSIEKQQINYYSDWDRWFAEEHDGTPVEFTVCEVDTGDLDCDHISMCATKGPGAEGEHSLSFPGKEKHCVRHRFLASSYIEAAQKMNDAMGFGPYKPHPDWSESEGRWVR